MPMHITMYLYHNVIPTHQTTLLRCIKCNRPLLKFSADDLVIANNGIHNFELFEPSSMYIEHICHSCGTIYSILYQ